MSKCFLGFQGSRKDFAQQKLCGIISGLPQKSHGEFCGKRSGRRIRSCGKRSAPQTKPPCRDEVGSLPLANLETAYYPCRFRAPAQMRSRCVGRGDASRAVKPRGTQRWTCWLCGDESAVSTARDGVRRGTSLTEGLLIPCTSRKESSLPRKARNPRPSFRLSAPPKSANARPPSPPPAPRSPAPTRALPRPLRDRPPSDRPPSIPVSAPQKSKKKSRRITAIPIGNFGKGSSFEKRVGVA